MNPTIRRIVVSGAATVALLSGAGTATAAVTDEHEATVVAIAKTDANDPAGITNGITPDNGSGAAIQNPVDGLQPANVNQQQIQTQAGGGTMAVGLVAILVGAIIVFVRVKKHDLKVGDAVVATLFGIALSGTVIGSMGDQFTESAIASIGSALGGL